MMLRIRQLIAAILANKFSLPSKGKFQANRSAYLIFAAPIGCILLVAMLPFWTSVRTLVTEADKALLGFSPNLEVVPLTKPVTQFKLKISRDINTANEKPSNYQKFAYPHRYPRRVSLAFATFGRVNNCDVWIQLGANIQSNRVPCASIKDNSQVSFKLSEPLYPGLFEVTAHWQGHPGNEVAIYAYEDKNLSEYWLAPFSGPAILTLPEVLLGWGVREPIKALLYCLCLVALASLIFVKNKQNTFNYLLAIVVLATTLIAVPYSGFDETAHIDMFYHQLHDGNDLKPVEFWKNVKTEMKKFEFHRFHNGSMPEDGQCPHSIVNACGYSPRPEHLYKRYAIFLKTIFSSELLRQPSFLRSTAITIHIFILFLTIGLIAAMGGKQLFETVAVILIFYGGWLSQQSSVTNDVPMILYGIYLAALMTKIATKPISTVSFLSWYSLAVFFEWCLIDVDLSALSAIPVLIAMPLLWLLMRKSRPALQFQHKDFSKTAILTCAYLSALASLLVLGKYILTTNFGGLKSFLRNNLPSGQLLDNLAKFDSLYSDALSLWIYFKSFFGSFVWGHSYYHGLTYTVLIFVLITTYGIGLNSLFTRAGGRLSSFVVLLLFGLLFLSQLTLLQSAYLPPSLALDEITRDSYLKTRFTAPGIAAIITPSMVGIQQLLIGDRSRSVLIKLTLGWSLVLLAYYLPKFFLVDIY